MNANATPAATHVLDPTATRATHVFDAALVAASPLPRRYTLAGFPSGNLRVARGQQAGRFVVRRTCRCVSAVSEWPRGDRDSQT